MKPHNDSAKILLSKNNNMVNKKSCISLELRALLIKLAQKYEQRSFIDADPSMVLHRYKKPSDIEVASIIAAVLSFGKRDLFLKKIFFILDIADSCGGPEIFIKDKYYKIKFVGPDCNIEQKFYRFYSYNDFLVFFDNLSWILNNYDSLGQYFCLMYKKALASSKKESLPLAPVICDLFPSCAIIPHGKNSANKRINMFVRWMVRQNSPVDLGLWTWYKAKDLIIPLDVHVLTEAYNLGLLANKKASGNLKTAIELTEAFKEIWPQDPCKGDFALFGLGVDSLN